MNEPEILDKYCDYIDEEIYDYCIQCYRYDICKAAWLKEEQEKENK